MIVNYRTIDLFGQAIFTWVDVQTPMRATGTMPDDEACFSYLVSGITHLYSEKEELKVEAKQAFLSKCGTYITHMLSDQEEGLFSSVTVHFKKDILEKIYDKEVPSFLKGQIGNTQHSSVHVAASDLIQQYFKGLIHYFNHRELITDEIIVLKLKEIILLLLQTENSPHVREIMDNLFSTHTLGFKEIIETHLYSAISIAELAALTHLSLSSFKRKFKHIYADTPGRYFINRRIEKVADLLLISDETISQIAFDCGFSSVSHVSKVFKQHYGVSPSEYRVTHTQS